jgi:cation diffusion facilitator family transporter
MEAIGRRPGAAERVALLSLGATFLLLALKFGVWALTGSLAVLSQALDSLLDVVALLLVFLGIRLASKPADDSHHYGHAKAENLAAFAQTLLIGVFVIGISVEALRRLLAGGPEVATPTYALVLLGISIAVDAWRVTLLLRTARRERSEALKAGALNIAGDLATAALAMLSLFLVREGIEDADALGALVVSVIVGVAAVRLARRSMDVLMDRAPIARLRAIQEAAAKAAGVTEARRVRVRGTGDQLFADVTVAAGRTTSLERAHDISEAVEREIELAVPGTDVIVHVEPAATTEGLVERVQAAASRAPDVHEIHNVLIHAFDDNGRHKLHVTLHAKVRPGVSLLEAHDLANEIESSVSRELGEAVRVDVHVEPLQPTAFGQDVTADREDLVESITALAQHEEDILDCHEVLITSTGSELAVVAHVRGRADLPLARIHDASTRIEKAINKDHPEIGPVLIHFEP